ncbi:MAG: penicillin-binding protein 2, partial [Alphaproteobacteria bacterium]|nr:penicillin-binding protein 2 [Alphaproteobacteria bacterium]
GHSYAHKALLSSFLGAFPINNPRYIVYAFVDEPHGNAKSHGFATGGWTAAPVVGHTIQRMAPLLGIEPVDETTPEIRNALQIDGAQVRKVAAN